MRIVRAISAAALVLLLLAPHGTSRAAGRHCPPPAWCGQGDVRYVPRSGYDYTNGSAAISGGPLGVEWGSGSRISSLCVSTGRGVLEWPDPPRRGRLAVSGTRICEVVISTYRDCHALGR